MFIFPLYTFLKALLATGKTGFVLTHALCHAFSHALWLLMRSRPFFDRRFVMCHFMTSDRKIETTHVNHLPRSHSWLVLYTPVCLETGWTLLFLKWWNVQSSAGGHHWLKRMDKMATWTEAVAVLTHLEVLLQSTVQFLQSLAFVFKLWVILHVLSITAADYTKCITVYSIYIVYSTVYQTLKICLLNVCLYKGTHAALCILQQMEQTGDTLYNS